MWNPSIRASGYSLSFQIKDGLSLLVAFLILSVKIVELFVVFGLLVVLN